MLAVHAQLAIDEGEIRVNRGLARHGTDLTARIDYFRQGDSERYQAHDVRGRLGPLSVAIPTASVVGRRDERGGVSHEGTLSFAASGELASLAEIPLSLGSVGRIEPTGGTVFAEGTYSQTVSLGGGRAAARVGSPEILGNVRVRDVEIALPDLGTALRVPEAEASLKTPALVWSAAEAEIDGQRVAISGAISGPEYLWKDSELRLHALSDVAVAEVLWRISEANTSIPWVEPPSGTVRVEALFEGPLVEQTRWSQSFHLVPRDLLLALGDEATTQRIEVDGGEVTVRPEVIDIAELGVTLNGLPLSVSGDLTPSGGELRVRSQSDLRLAKEAMPRVFSQVILAGPAEGDILISAEWPPDPAAEGGPDLAAMTRLETLHRIAGHLRDRLEGWDQLVEPLPFDIDAVFRLRDCEVTPLMAPADITHASGEITWDGRTFRVANALAQFTDNTSRAVVSGEFTPLNPQHMTFELDAPEADLTPWIRPWIRRDRAHLSPAERLQMAITHGHAERQFRLEGRITADAVQWRDLEGGRGNAFISHEFNRPERVSRLRVEQVVLTGYEGRVTGHFLHTGTELGNTHEIHVNAEGVDLAPFLTDMRGGNPTQVEGRLTGRVFLRRIPGQSWRDVSGEGVIEVTESSLLRSTLFHELGRLTNVQEFSDISFTTIAADLSVGHQRVDVTDLVMDTTWTDIEGHGRVGFDRSIDFDVQMTTLRSMFKGIPLISWLGSVLDSTINSVFLGVHVGGTLDEPEVRVVQPLVESLLPG
jgi:hypothetical protein